MILLKRYFDKAHKQKEMSLIIIYEAIFTNKLSIRQEKHKERLRNLIRYQYFKMPSD